MVTRVRNATAQRVIVAVEPSGPGEELTRALERRGVRTVMADSLSHATGLAGSAIVLIDADHDCTACLAVRLACRARTEQQHYRA